MQPLGTNKIMEPLRTKNIMQPLGTKKVTQPLRTKNSSLRVTPNLSTNADSITNIFVSAGEKKRSGFFFLEKIKIYIHCHLGVAKDS